MLHNRMGRFIMENVPVILEMRPDSVSIRQKILELWEMAVQWQRMTNSLLRWYVLLPIMVLLPSMFIFARELTVALTSCRLLCFGLNWLVWMSIMSDAEILPADILMELKILCWLYRLSMTGNNMYFTFFRFFLLVVTDCKPFLQRREYRHRYTIRYLRINRKPLPNIALCHCRWLNEYIGKNSVCRCLRWWRMKRPMR